MRMDAGLDTGPVVAQLASGLTNQLRDPNTRSNHEHSGEPSHGAILDRSRGRRYARDQAAV